MAEERINTVSTRMNLKIQEQKLKSIQKGFSLLKCKSDALQIKCKEYKEKIKEKIVFSLFVQAYTELEKADFYGCDWHVFKRICLESQTKLICSLEQVCGIGQANFKLERKTFDREILYKGGHKLKEIKHLFDNLINLLVELGTEKNNYNAIKTSFENTSKRKNSLEHKMIPKLENTVNYIEGELDEAEREEFFRLKKIQTSKLKQ